MALTSLFALASPMPFSLVLGPVPKPYAYFIAETNISALATSLSFVFQSDPYASRHLPFSAPSSSFVDAFTSPTTKYVFISVDQQNIFALFWAEHEIRITNWVTNGGKLVLNLGCSVPPSLSYILGFGATGGKVASSHSHLFLFSHDILRCTDPLQLSR